MPSKIFVKKFITYADCSPKPQKQQPDRHSLQSAIKSIISNIYWSMYYNNIMWESSQDEPNFLFKWAQQQPPSQIQQLIINKQEASYHNYLITMQNSNSNIPHSTRPPHPHTQPTVNTVLVKVESAQQDIPQMEHSSVNFILESSQLSQSSREESSSSHKGEEENAENKNKIDYNRDQHSQEPDLSPQSSIRKLYKLIDSGQTEVSKIQTRQRLIKSEATEQDRRLYEEDDHEEGQENEEEEYQEVKVGQAKYKQLCSKSLQDLITFPVLKSKMIKCVVKIENHRFFSLQTIIFDLFLYQEKRHLLRAKKKRFRTHFDVIGKEKSHIEVFAKVKSNFSRTQYKLIEFKKSIQFSEKSSEKSVQTPFSSQIIKVSPIQSECQVAEKEDCYLAYEPNFLGLQQQQLILLKAKKNLSKSQRFSDLKNCYQNSEYGRYQKFSTRLAEKGPDGKLMLDFKQGSLQDSSKNMILQDQNGEVGLMFAKLKEDLYILNVMHPFNLLQGFFLALCNLDHKLLTR